MSNTEAALKELLTAGYTITAANGVVFIKDNLGKLVIVSRPGQPESYPITYAHGVLVSDRANKENAAK